MQIPEYANSSDGVKVAIHDLGGDGPLLLFCHATGFHGRTLTPLANQLADRFRCVALDFRGHGDTLLPVDAGLGWECLTDDLLAVTDTLKAVGTDGAPLRAVGHSLGGGLIAVAEDRKPGTFRCAWSFEPVLVPTTDEPLNSIMSDAARRRRRAFPSREAAYRRYASRAPFNSILPEALSQYVEYGFHDLPDGSVTLACAPETEATVFESAWPSKSLEAAGRIDMPYGIAAGNEPEGVGQLTRLAARTHSNLTLFEFDLSHLGPFEDPALVAKDIREWFSCH